MNPTRNQQRRRAIRAEQARRRTEAAKQPRQAHQDPTHRTLSAVLAVTVELGNIPADIDPGALAQTIRERVAGWTNEPEHGTDSAENLTSTARNSNELIRRAIEQVWTARMDERTPQLARHFRAACLKRWQALETARRVPWLDIRPGILTFTD